MFIPLLIFFYSSSFAATVSPVEIANYTKPFYFYDDAQDFSYQCLYGPENGWEEIIAKVENRLKAAKIEFKREQGSGPFSIEINRESEKLSGPEFRFVLKKEKESQELKAIVETAKDNLDDSIESISELIAETLQFLRRPKGIEYTKISKEKDGSLRADYNLGGNPGYEICTEKICRQFLPEEGGEDLQISEIHYREYKGKRYPILVRTARKLENGDIIQSEREIIYDISPSVPLPRLIHTWNGNLASKVKPPKVSYLIAHCQDLKKKK
jgi:hypothetical protein